MRNVAKESHQHPFVFVSTSLIKASCSAPLLQRQRDQHLLQTKSPSLSVSRQSLQFLLQQIIE